MDETCKSNRANPPFTTDLSQLLTPCTTEAFWLLCLGAVVIQVFRNFVWIWNAQLIRETLALEKNDPKRWGKIIWQLTYTALSFVLYVFAFLIIVGGNVYFLLAILCGNLIGTYSGMLHQKADEHISQGPTELEDITQLFRKARTAQRSEKEMRDIEEFIEELKLYLANSASAQNVINSKNTYFKF